MPVKRQAMKKRSRREISGTTYEEQRVVIYDAIREIVAEEVDETVPQERGREMARKIMDTVFGGALDAASRDGSFRLNGGFGFLRLKILPAKPDHRMPNGDTVDIPSRRKIEFVHGRNLDTLVRKPSIEEVNGGPVEKSGG